MEKKIVYLTGDDTVRVFDSFEDANYYRESLFEDALQAERDEGLCVDDDSEDYESRIAFMAGQNADGECEIYDYNKVMDNVGKVSVREQREFAEECTGNSDDDIDLTGHDIVRQVIESMEPEESSIY